MNFEKSSEKAPIRTSADALGLKEDEKSSMSSTNFTCQGLGWGSEVGAG